jgi:putative ABC transport system permease protein
METLWQDLKFAVRVLIKKRGFTAIVVFTLAIGIGANTAVFSVVNAVLMRPLPFRDGDQIVRIYAIRGGSPPYISLRPKTFLSLKDQGQFFQDIAAQRFTNFTLETPDGPERVIGIMVSENWLGTLGLEPVLGRGFLPEEERKGNASGVVLVSHGFWERRLGGDPNVLGQTVRLNDEPRTIVGVLPPGFNYPYDSELWVPMNLHQDVTGTWGLNVQARLKSGTTREAALAELSTVSHHIAEELPDELQGLELTAIPTREVLLGDDSNVVLALAVAVGFVLLIACANVGNLLLAQSVARQRELVIRTTLGASRFRQVRQLLTESVLLGLLGGVAGLGIAAWSARLMTVLVPGRMGNVLGEIPIDGSVLLFALVASLVTGIIFGLAPAARTMRSNLEGLMRDGGRAGGGRASHRLLGGLVVSEVALALVLLTGAGLMIRNLEKLYGLDLGYASDEVVTLTVSLSSSSKYESDVARVQFVHDVEDQLEALPGVEAAGTTSIFPSSRGNFLAAIEIEGRPTEPNETLIINHRMVSPSFHRALGIPLIRGRLFNEADRDGSSPVAVVSEALASKYFPGEDPIGKRLRNQRGGADAPWITIVGLVGDVHEFYDVKETWYIPYAQNAISPFGGQLVFAVRAKGLDSVSDSLRRAVWAVDPTLPVFGTATTEELYGESVTEQRLGTTMVGLFAIFGLLMAALGIYGVMSYGVSERTREIGIGMALGARRGQILSSVIGRGLRLALVGVAIGLAGALALTRFMSSILTEVGATDPSVFATVASLLTIVAIAACWIPALRATKIDPVEALRSE